MYMFDTFANFLSGLGVIGRDKMTGSEYVTRLWTREQLETAFRSDWIARKAIAIPAHDATREWRLWQAEQDQIEKLEATEKRLHVQLKLQQALTKARLYGGCCILIGVDGNPEKELDPETIKKDGLKFLHVLAPHQLTIDDLVKDIEDPYYGQPEFYILRDETEKFGDAKIHPSRMVRLIGLDSPDPMSNFGWGDPMMQMIHDAVNSAGTVSGSIATMISEAKLDVIKIPGLTEIFSTTSGTNRILKRFSEANVAKSVVNGILMDAEEEWQRIGVNFAGMPEILQMYLQIAAGAADIPVTRFVGMSPAGLNATGESDLNNYYDRIASDQELRLTPALEKLDKAIQQDALGKFDENIFYEWKPLWQMDEAQKSEIAKRKADTAMVDVNSGLLPFEALAKGRGNQLIEDGTYPGLESALEEAIANQEALAEQGIGPDGQPLDPNQGPGGMGGQPPQNGGGNGGMPAWMSGDSAEVAGKGVGPFGMRLTRLRTLLRTQLRTQLHDLLIEFDPNKHPRELSGQHGGEFTTTGGAPTRSAGFVSPSVKSGLDFKGAVRELNSRQQTRLRLASRDINKKLDLAGVREVNILAAWKDGAENSIMSRSDSDWDHTTAATVMKGHLADQKAVLVFQQGPGMSVLAQFDATGDLNKIHKQLVRDGIENHTIVPREGGATIYVAYIDKPDLASLDKAAERYGKGNPVYFQHGKAEFIGDTPEYVGDLAGTGTDRQQRDRARSVYERVINESPVQNAEAVWKNVRDYWGAPTTQQGYALTSNAIIAEFPNIKKNSVLVGDAAKMMGERASVILKQDLGMEFDHRGQPHAGD